MTLEIQTLISERNRLSLKYSRILVLYHRENLLL